MVTGIFDRSALGKRTPSETIMIDAGRIAFFARAVGEHDPIHQDRNAARAAGYPDIIAPITFPIFVRLEYERLLAAARKTGSMQLINCDFRRLLHGSERYEYSGRIFAGDCVEVATDVTGFEDKKGGTLELAFLSTRISHAERGTLVTMTSTAIHRLG